MIKILKAIRMTLKKGSNQTLWGPWTNAREFKNQGAPVQCTLCTTPNTALRQYFCERKSNSKYEEQNSDAIKLTCTLDGLQ